MAVPVNDILVFVLFILFFSDDGPSPLGHLEDGKLVTELEAFSA